MDNSQNMSYKAGQAKGQAQESNSKSSEYLTQARTNRAESMLSYSNHRVIPGQKIGFHQDKNLRKEEKGSQMMDNVANAAQSAKESMQEAGQQLQAKAQGAVDAVKDATGMNK